MQATFAVLTDRMVFQFVMSFLPGLPHVLLEFERDAYTSLRARDPYRDTYSSGGIWLQHALLTNDLRIDALLYRLRRQRYYAEMPLLAVSGDVLTQVCTLGNVAHLERLHSTPGVDTDWSASLLRVTLAEYDRQSKENPVRQSELRAMAQWLLRYHPEACVDQFTSRVSLLLGTEEERSFVEELLRANALDVSDIPRTTVAKERCDVMSLLLGVCPQAITRAFVETCARLGNLEALQALHDHGSLGMVDMFTARVMDVAAGAGHIQTVRFLHENRTEGCTTDAMDNAAANGHLEVVRFLHENRTEGCTTEAIDLAASCGCLEVVVFLVENRTEGFTQDRAIADAARNNNVVVVQYLWEHRVEDHLEDPTSWPLNDAVAYLRREWAKTQTLTPAQQLREAVAQTSTTVDEFTRLHSHLHSASCDASLLEFAIATSQDAFAMVLIHDCDVVRNAIGAAVVNTAIVTRKDDVNHALVRALFTQCLDRGRLTDSLLLEVAARQGDLSLVQLLLGLGMTCTVQAMNAAMKGHRVRCVVPYLIRNHPDCISTQTLYDALNRNESGMFMDLHSAHHHLCPTNGMMMRVVLDDSKSTWPLLLHMNKHCSNIKVDKCDLANVWKSHHLVDVLVFLWCVRKDPVITTSVESAPRNHRQNVFRCLEAAVPSLFTRVAAMPWCCQLRELRRLVESGELTLDDVNSARAAANRR